MKNNAKEIGNLGEQRATIYLKNKGYTVIKNNYYGTNGEIDIIARKDKYIIFVEVKTRKSNSMTNGIESVNYRKRKNIIATATKYLYENRTELQPRFDIISITNGKEISIEHIENAFSLEE